HWDLELMRYDLAEDSPAVAAALANVPLPDQASIAGVLRNDRVEAPERIGVLQAGDRVFVIATAVHVDALNRTFIAPHHPDRLEEHQFFGDLVLEADAGLADIATFYGVEMPPGADDASLGEYLQRVFRKRPVVGDRLKVGRVEFVVREVANGRVSRVGLKF
ncbi:MAG: transporter associated domain-containing protein, partial [Pseudomonadota bacterium]